jgi:hypothetical protein
MRDTVYSAILPASFLLLTAIVAVHASSPQQPRPASSTTLVGCLVDEREYANAYGLAPGPRSSDATRQLVIVADGGAAYALVGPEESKLSADVHRRVSLEGIIEQGVVISTAEPDPQPDSTPTPTGAVGVTEDGSPAHEPTDAVATIRDGGRARRPNERAASVSELDRINVGTARVLGDKCGESLAQAPSPDPVVVSAVSVTRVPSSRSAPVTATLIGCLVRRDADGTPVSDGLTLLATPRDDRTFLTRSAVPGSLPSGGGSGTVGTSGSIPREPIAYRLTGELNGLSRYVGQRMEITGVTDPATAPATRSADSAATAPTRAERSVETAHPTAVEHTLQVTSFRTAAGVCR